MMFSEIGKILLILGIVLSIAGILIMFSDSIPFIKHLGKLPGDINIKRENFSFHFPVATSIILSIIISLIFFIISRFK